MSIARRSLLDNLFATLLRHEAVEVNFLLRPGAICIEFVVDGDERYVEREVALDERRDLTAPDFGGDERAWT